MDHGREEVRKLLQLAVEKAKAEGHYDRFSAFTTPTIEDLVDYAERAVNA